MANIKINDLQPAQPAGFIDLSDLELEAIVGGGGFRKIFGRAASTIGSVIGGYVGGFIGGLVGSIVPGLGTASGASVGASAGAAAGAYYSQKI